MDRKLCADCGNSSLASEATCWACGGSRFTPMATPHLGDQTLSLGSRFDRTMSWRVTPQNAQLWWGLAAAFGMALFMCIIGFWVGRASSPTPVAAVSAASNPVVLPTPPTALTFSPVSGSSGVSGASVTPASAPADTAQVTVHSRPMPGGDPNRRTASNIAPYPAGLATPMTPGPIITPRPVAPAPGAAAPHRTFQVTTSRRINDTITAPEAAPLGPGAVPAVTSNEGGAVVTVRNDAATSVTLRLDGPSSRMVIVGAGSTVPLNLAAGSYRISADSSSATSTRSTLSVSASGSYSLVVSSHPDGGREVLSLMEPALGG